MKKLTLLLNAILKCDIQVIFSIQAGQYSSSDCCNRSLVIFVLEVGMLKELFVEIISLLVMFIDVKTTEGSCFSPLGMGILPFMCYKIIKQPIKHFNE